MFSKVIKDALKIDAHESHIENTIVHHVQQAFINGVQFINGFELFHKALASHKIKNCIATNACDRSLSHLRKSMNLESFFGKHIYNISHVKNVKPAPDLFLHAAKELGVDPSECVVFEDSLVGFNAAKAAGAGTVPRPC